jgi:uncharacterized protein YjbI with pentapeptide repeats
MEEEFATQQKIQNEFGNPSGLSLAYRQFMGVLFQGVDMTGADVGMVKFVNVDFKNCTLDKIDFCQADSLVNVRFENCSLDTKTLCGAKSEGDVIVVKSWKRT